jgi:hypothetical protein
MYGFGRLRVGVEVDVKNVGVEEVGGVKLEEICESWSW